MRRPLLSLPSLRGLLGVLALAPIAASCSKCSSRGKEQVTATPEATTKTKPKAAGPSAFLAPLPEGAAIYGTLRLDVIGAIEAVMPATALADWKKEFDDHWEVALAKDAIADALGLDTTRPIAFAVVPGDGTAALSLVHQAVKDGGTHAAVTKAWDAVKAGERPPRGAVTIVVPIAKGRPKAKLIEVLGVATSAPLKSCDADAACPELGGRRPSYYAPETAVYVGDDTVRIDRLVVRGPTPSQSTKWLGSIGGSSGGPKGRCTALDDDALGSVCLATPELATLGIGTGSDKVLGALSMPGIDEKQILEILLEGEKEIGRNVALRDASAGDLGDGTYSLTKTKDAVQLEGSWLLGRRRPKGMETPVCAKELEATTATLLAPLRDGLLEGKPAFASLGELREQTREAGWSGMAMLAAGQWPVALPYLDDGPLKGPALAGPCASIEGGRLWVRLRSETREVHEALRAIGL